MNVDLRVMRMDVDREKRKGRLKLRWMDSVNVDLREKGLSGEETHNRAVWAQLVRNTDPHIEVGEDAMEEESTLCRTGMQFMKKQICNRTGMHIVCHRQIIHAKIVAS